MKVTNYSKNKAEVYLTRYKKKGILRIIFSRIAFIILLLIIQINIIYLVFDAFQQYVPYYRVFMSFFSIVMIFYLFNNDMDSSAKLTWMIIIAIFPIPGSLFLAFTQLEIGHRALKKRMQRVIEETRNILPEQEDVMDELKDDTSGLVELCTYLNKTGCFRVYKNSAVTYFNSGEDMYEALIEELHKAKDFIFLEYFIISEGHMWGRILKTLIDKVNEGVEVRVLYDGMCEMSLLPHDYAERLRTFGIDAKTFSPIHPFVSTYYNYRDHRKILVIDGKVAFNGGINLADEYINRKARFGHWKDTAVMVKGDAVKEYTLMFMQMWSSDLENVNLGKYLDFPTDKKIIKENPEGYVIPYSDIPLDEEKVGENVYIDVLNRARKYVHIMTPYLILDDELLNAIRYAAIRGIEVSIILPGIPDKKMAYALAKSHYKRLINAGVNIYEYEPGFVHAKNFSSDDVKAIVGSINLDYRSLYHHFECATYMYKTRSVKYIEEDFQNTLKKCRKITPESIKNEKLFYKVAGTIVKLVAPLM